MDFPRKRMLKVGFRMKLLPLACQRINEVSNYYQCPHVIGHTAWTWYEESLLPWSIAPPCDFTGQILRYNNSDHNTTHVVDGKVAIISFLNVYPVI